MISSPLKQRKQLTLTYFTIILAHRSDTGITFRHASVAVIVSYNVFINVSNVYQLYLVQLLGDVDTYDDNLHICLRYDIVSGLQENFSTQYLLPDDLTIQNLFILLQLVLCRVAAVQGLPVHHHSADYNFWFFGIIEFIDSDFEN